MFRLVVGRHELGWGGNRANTVDLQKRITALQTEVAKWKALAERRQRSRCGFVSAIAVLILALGFIVGVYSAALKQTAAGLALANLGRADRRAADCARCCRRDGDGPGA